MPPVNAADIAQMRARNGRVVAAYRSQVPGTGGPLTVRTSHGEVSFESITTATDQNGIEYLEVYLRGDTVSGDPHFRIYNPPTLVPDPSGTVEGRGGRKYRDDPVGAVAEIIGRNGGRQKGRKPR